MDEKSLRGDEVAAVLHISRSIAYTLMGKGRIPTIRFGKSAWVRESDLALFIATNIRRESQGRN